MANIAPRHLRGRYQGTWSLGWAVGWTVGPAVGTWLCSRSTTALWLGCGVVGMVSATMVALLPEPADVVERDEAIAV